MRIKKLPPAPDSKKRNFLIHKKSMTLCLILFAGSLLYANVYSHGNVYAPKGLEQTKDVKSDSVENKTVMEFVDIPFDETTIEDKNLAKGKATVKIKGVNGNKTVTYQVFISNGRETRREIISEEITLQPITQVTLVGAKQSKSKTFQPNGTHITLGTNTSMDSNIPGSPAPSKPLVKLVKQWSKWQHKYLYYCVEPEDKLYYLEAISLFYTVDECNASI